MVTNCNPLFDWWQVYSHRYFLVLLVTNFLKHKYCIQTFNHLLWICRDIIWKQAFKSFPLILNAVNIEIWKTVFSVFVLLIAVIIKLIASNPVKYNYT